MKIPKTFTLAGIRWTVEETSAISEMGHCSAETSTIRLRKDLSSQVTMSCSTPSGTRWARTTTDEVEVDAQGNLLHQFLEQHGK